MDAYFADTALLPTGWARRVRIEVGADGNFSSVHADASDDKAARLAGPVLPGMANLHSHAFQRAMAGLAESRDDPDRSARDDFWGWRELMYRFVARLTPAHANAIARFLYIELLKSGYTAVAEFQYVHNDALGQAYADPAEMSLAHLSAARDTGIAITLLPVLYAHAGFGALPLAALQLRFRSNPEKVLAIVAAARRAAGADADVRVGAAPHSLRATDLDVLQDLLAGLDTLDRSAPVHIHASEQVREVEDSVAFSGRRPVEWLLEHLPVDARWCIVHATHLTPDETRGLAQSGAVAGLCPTTEANLGDGVFPLTAYRAVGGRYGIGSDSHVSRNPFEELRLLETVQRLIARRRNLATGRPGSPAGDSTGTTLWLEAAAGGAQACGRRMGALAAGLRADLVVLDPRHPNLQAREAGRIADSAIFAGGDNPVRDVMVGGRWRVRDGCHALEAEAAAHYAQALRALLA